MEETEISLEEQLFDWETWDRGANRDMVFGEVTLKVQIGSFPIGTKFDSAYFALETSELVLNGEDGQEYTFQLKLMAV